ncbi:MULTISPECIES: hypothetical protein [Burkholderia]|uniref:hypothetical protein n=1 Tax=Burkholderia TaxID=32008 RepID=UPI001582C63C|nr:MULTISPECIES: hypothetical protein [Burkholderia]
MKKRFLKRPYEWQIGLRDAGLGKRAGSTGFTSLVAVASMAGIALGMAERLHRVT